MFEAFKWLKKTNKGDLNEILISKTNVRTRSNEYRVDVFRFRNRMMDEGNKPSRCVVDANTGES